MVTTPVYALSAAAPTPPGAPAPSPTTEHGTPDDAHKSPMQRPTREERLAQLREYDQDKIQKHWAEPVDRSWSVSTTPSLKTGLETLAKTSKFTVKEVDCRNTSCIAVFDWPNYADAMAEYAKIAHARLDVNCSRGITLPDVQDKSQPLQATMVFDCGQWKAGGSGPMGGGAR